ncbi:MAG: D-glycero-D-manno-heptose 1,7-bisphosphate phosphatase [Paraglaciecola psychrophila]|jgi:D-glycero-D-manno-heptose 1,7-bisphosphate phosphatase
MKLVILDRDGVINHDSDAYIKSAEQWLPIAGSIEAIADLHRAGFTVTVATNQSGLARKLFDLQQLQDMHRKMEDLVVAAGGQLAGIFYCPHGPEHGCDCRKPKPGLIDMIARELQVSAAGAYLIGDSLRDLEAGVQRGCIPLLVRTGKGAKTLIQLAQQDNPALSSVAVFDDLAAVAHYLIEQN